MFKCKVCLEKESRIHDLKAQLEDLRKLVFPSHNQEASDSNYGLDAIFNDSPPSVIHMTNDAIQAEASALLSGNYDNSQSET